MYYFLVSFRFLCSTPTHGDLYIPSVNINYTINLSIFQGFKFIIFKKNVETALFTIKY